MNTTQNHLIFNDYNENKENCDSNVAVVPSLFYNRRVNLRNNNKENNITGSIPKNTTDNKNISDDTGINNNKDFFYPRIIKLLEKDIKDKEEKVETTVTPCNTKTKKSTCGNEDDDMTLEDAYDNFLNQAQQQSCLSHSSKESDSDDSSEDSIISRSSENLGKYNKNKKHIFSTPKNSYKKFGLSTRNTPVYMYDEDTTTHSLLPRAYNNNSKYKRKMYAYFRFKLNKKGKNDSCSHIITMKNSFLCKGNMHNSRKHIEKSLVFADFEKEKDKIKIKFPTKKKEFKEKILFGEKKEKVFFSLFHDDDLGFGMKWQRQLKTTEQDDDVNTDNEQLRLAKRHIAHEVKESVALVNEDTKKIRNIRRFKDCYLLIENK